MNHKFSTYAWVIFGLLVGAVLIMGLDIGDYDYDCKPGDTIKNINREWVCWPEVYGEMYNYTPAATGYLFIIDTAGTYHNLTGLGAGDLKGFTFTETTEELGGSYLTAQYNGVYKATFTISFASSQAGGLYGIAITHNWNVSKHRECYSRREAKTEVANAGISCELDLEIGDKISIQIENENTDRNMIIHTANLDLVRIGVLT